MATSFRAPAAFVLDAQGFLDITGSQPRLELVTRVSAHEGPVYVAAEDALYVTSTPDEARHTAILRIDLPTGTVTRVDSRTAAANGMALDVDGRGLIVCDQGSLSARAAICVVDPVSGETRALVDSFRALALNSPNDVAVAPDGSIWFTDPSYGWLQGFRPRPRLRDNVYRLDPSHNQLALAADSFDKPNGLAFSPDGSVLYVGDSGADRGTGTYDPDRPHHVVAFDVDPDGNLSKRRVFAVIEPGAPDGLKVDGAGRVYVSSAAGVNVYDTAGELLGEIALPGAVNFCFGGTSGNQLFITTDDAVWCAHLAATAFHQQGA